MIERLQAKRRQRDFVTIAHLSDWHLVGAQDRLRFRPNPDVNGGWNGLIRDLRDCKPDLICITGDVVDSPVGTVLQEAEGLVERLRRWLGSEEALGWQRSLADTLVRARELFERICDEAGLVPETALHVVPGNHDFRIQGIFDNASCRDLFDAAFGRYFRSATIRFDADHAGDADDDPIDVTIVGFDSLALDVAGNFAAGAISREEYARFDDFDDPADAGDPLVPAFRVALVHHHPLPVVASEALVETTPVRHEGRFEGLARVAQGEQTMLFRNGGVFLHGALRHRVNVVLHGHHHNAWHTVVRYPTDAGDHRMLVAAAGSIGEMSDAGSGYNIVRLRRNGNIEVQERTRRNSPEEYVPVERLRLFGDSELRLVRHEAARHALLAREARGGERYGLAEADQVRRRIEIRDDGSADYTILLSGLRASHGDVAFLPMLNVFSKFNAVGRRIVRLPGPQVPHYAVTLVQEAGEAPEDFPLGVRFVPALTRDRPVDVEIRYQVYNCFDFAEEYFRGREGVVPGAEPRESIGYSPQRVFPKRLVQSLVFPRNWRPPGVLRLEVMRPSAGARPATAPDARPGTVPDHDEQAYHEWSLDYFDDLGVASLTVDLPLPGIEYRITWPLETLDAYTAARHAGGSDALARALRSLSIGPAARAEVGAMLADLFARYGVPRHGDRVALFGAATELTLHIARVRPEGREDARAQVAYLELIATAGAYAPLRDDAGNLVREFRGGEGLVGYAHRTGRTQTIRQGRDMEAYRPRQPGRKHEALWCIPLAIPPESGTTGQDAAGRMPVYAILSAGSFVDDGTLDERGKAFPLFVEEVTGSFNRALCDCLLARR